MRTSLLLPLLAATLGACSSTGPGAATPLADAFSEASEASDVPVEVLMATGYAFTRMDQRFGEVNREGGVGVMNLRQGGAFPSLEAAAERVGQDPARLVEDAAWNVKGAAALFRAEADAYERLTGEPVDTLEEWYPFVAAWSGSADPLVADGFAAQVYDFVQLGFAIETPEGELVQLAPTSLPWRAQRTAAAGSGLIDKYVPACSSNYSNYSRGSGDVSYVIVHTMEGSYSGSISWFQNCSSQVSAHYSVRSSDGEITQSVDEADVAWHAGNWTYNERSIGIEHEGYVSQPSTWYTDAMLRSSAALVADICDRYGIPKDRAHIIGHNEVPGCSSGNGGGSGCHTDPGTGWDWDYYMSLVTGQGSGSPSMGGSGTTSGAYSGTFSATAKVTRSGVTDTCEGPISGAVQGGQFYLTGACTLRNHPDAVTNLQVTWTGSVNGTAVEGKMLADGRQAAFTGTYTGTTIAARIQGQEDLRGDVGVVEYDVSISAAP